MLHPEGDVLTMNQALTVRTVSKHLGISSRMLRYYEKAGLVKSGRMDDYAYRVYDEDAVKRLRQIIILRKLRVPVKRIRDIFDNSDAANIIEVFERSINELDERITALSTIKAILGRLVYELREKANIHLQLNYLGSSDMLDVVGGISMPNNILEEIAMNDLRKADDVLNAINDADVRLIYLPPATVASARSLGGDPESESDNIMGKFITDAELFRINPGTRLYGFNSPDTVDGKHKHGYEVWATIPDNFEVPKPLVKKWFAGGLYAAYTMKNDFKEWKLFNNWLLANNDFEYDKREPLGMSGWLEEHFNSYNLYGLKNKKHTLTHIDFLIPIKEKTENVNNGESILRESNKIQNIIKTEFDMSKAIDVDLATLIPGTNQTEGMSGEGKNIQKFNISGGELILTADGDLGCAQTAENYTLPLRINLTAKTDSTNIRVYYKMGEIIFNWECNLDELRFHDILFGTNYGYEDKGKIPQNEYVDITWVIEKEFMEIYVNGELRHKGDNYQYIGLLMREPDQKVCAPIKISAAWGSTVTIKSLKVTEL